jgi:hypothetical protein
MGDEERTEIKDLLEDQGKTIQEVHSFLLGDLSTEGFVSEQRRRLKGLESDMSELKNAEEKRGSNNLVASTTSGGTVAMIVVAIKHFFGNG